MFTPEVAGGIVFPETTGAAVYLGQVGSQTLLELPIPLIEAPDGTVGIKVEHLGLLATSEVATGGIVWVRPDISDIEQQAQRAPEELDKTQTIFAGGRVVVDHESKGLFVEGSLTYLLPKPFSVLEFFSAYPGRLLSRDEIMLGVWGDTDRTVRSVDQCVRKIRKALGDYQGLVRTRHSLGYIFVDTEAAPDTEAAAK